MKRHTLSICSALLLAAAACNKSEIPGDATSPRQTPVIIEATGLYDLQPAPASRATVDGDWQGVQKVALKMGDEVKEYTVSASDADGYRSATLACTDVPFYWTNRNPITVTAWWPLDEADITRMPAVKVAEDQSQLADFQSSDFISAEEQTVEFDAPKLTFTHRTARVVVNLTAGDGIASVEGATVSLANLSTLYDNPATVTACNTSGNTFEALTAPQTVSAGKCFIRVELGGGTFDFSPKNDVALAAGRRCTYNLRVEATGLTLEGSSIGGWNGGGGESGAAEDLGYTITTDDNGRPTYNVYNANGLLAWAEAARKDMSLNCTLTADITLPTVAEGESNWTPVGSSSNSYTGTFEGGDHTITGLTIYLPNQDYVGLFGMIGQYGTVGKGTVQHLTLAGVEITGNYSVGGVVGYNYEVTLTDCSVSGNVTGTGNNVGGVAGANISTLTDCTFSGDVTGTGYDVTGTGYNVGGVVGYNSGTLTDCSATGDVTGTGYSVGGVVGQNSEGGSLTACTFSGDVSGGNYVGGVVGWNYYKATVTGCTVLGDVTGTGDHVGGVVGYSYGAVTGCYHAAGNVTGTGYSVGGVAGINSGTLTGCYHAAGTVSGNGYVGGVAGYNYSGTLTACSATGDVTGTGNYVGGVAGVNEYGSTLTACYHAAGTVSGNVYVGGVAGYNWNGTLTACYWSNNLDAGVGRNDDGSIETTKVDGTDVTWQTAQSGMNEAIETWNDGNPDNPCNWRYDETDAATPPVLIPAN